MEMLDEGGVGRAWRATWKTAACGTELGDESWEKVHPGVRSKLSEPVGAASKKRPVDGSASATGCACRNSEALTRASASFALP